MTDAKQYNILHVTLDRTLREPGAYVVTIPTGFAQNWDYADVAETKWLYIVTGDEENPDEFMPYDNVGVAISPRQGVYNKIGENFQLNFDYESIGVNQAMLIRMVDDATGVVCGTFSIDYTFTDDHLAVLNPFVLASDREVTAPGSYTLEFPMATFYRSSDSEYLPAFKFRYVIAENGATVEPATENVVADPASGSIVPRIDNITVTFPDFTRIERSNIVDQLNTEIKVVNAAGTVVSEGAVNHNQTGLAANTMQIKFDPAVVENGRYEIIFARRIFLLGEPDDHRFNEEFSINYSITEGSIETVAGDDGNAPARIYDLRGVRVDSADAPGVYIIVKADGTATKTVVR